MFLLSPTNGSKLQLLLGHFCRFFLTQGHLGEKAHPSHAGILADQFQAPEMTQVTEMVGFPTIHAQDPDPAIFAVTAVALARMGEPGVGNSELEKPCPFLVKSASRRMSAFQQMLVDYIVVITVNGIILVGTWWLKGDIQFATNSFHNAHCDIVI